MPDYAGPLLQRLVLSRTLWLIVVWPVAGFAWQIVLERRRIARARGPGATKRALASARNAGIGCVLLATAATLAHGMVLASAPRDARVLYEPLARGARLGQLTADIDLLFDPLSATFCALACLVSLAAAAFLGRRPDTGWRPWAWLQLSLAGALLAFAADGVVGTALGWSVSGAAAAWLAGWNDSWRGIVAAMRSGVAISVLLLGAALLFWGLGGTWDGDDYAPEPQPRFAAVRMGGWPDGSGVVDSVGARSGAGALTFTSAPGALVFVDDARSPAGQSPFVSLPIRVGSHALRIHSGEGSNDEVLGRVTFEEGEERALVPLGPTIAFRAIADQIVLRDAADNTPMRTALERRVGPGGGSVVAASLIALIAAGGLMSGAMPTSDLPPALVALAYGATTAALGPYLIARVSFLFPLAQSAWLAVEAVGATILLVAGWNAPRFSSRVRRWAVFVGAAPAALAYLALGATGVATATCVFVASGAATAALYLSAAPTLALAHEAPGTAPAIGHQLLVLAPERLGKLLVSMDRWVVSALAGTIAAFVHALGWAMVTVDERVIAAPANFVAAQLVRVERGVEPMVGVTLGRAAWALLSVLAVAALAQALRSGR
jgi:hypothetical protein